MASWRQDHSILFLRWSEYGTKKRAQDGSNMDSRRLNIAPRLQPKQLKTFRKSACWLLDCMNTPRWPKMAEDAVRLPQNSSKKSPKTMPELPPSSGRSVPGHQEFEQNILKQNIIKHKHWALKVALRWTHDGPKIAPNDPEMAPVG